MSQYTAVIAPSRVGDPNSFAAESSAFFFSQLPAFRTEANAVSADLNARGADECEWGLVTYTPPIKPAVDLLTQAPDFTSGGNIATRQADAIADSLEGFIAQGNAAYDYIVELSNNAGAFAAVVNRPMLGVVSVVPIRADQRTDFNAKATQFWSSTAQHVERLNALNEYFFDAQVKPQDWGLIADAATETIDWGSI